MVQAEPRPMTWARPTLAPSTWRLPASPRRCQTTSQTLATPVAPRGWPFERRPPLAFTGHIDVVPLGARTWSKDPFAGETDNGKLYGRGTSDMKAGVAGFVAACIAMAPKLVASPGVTLIITAGEETGCEGAFHLARQKIDIGKAGALVVLTGGGSLLPGLG